MDSDQHRRPLDANQIAKDLDYKDFFGMAQQHSLPQRSQILGVGATIAALGKELAFYRSDIHWTNVAPEYTDPDILPVVDMEPDFNSEFNTWDLESIGDIFPDEHFDRIYCHGDDLARISPESRRTLGRALVNILNKDGLIHIAHANDNFIDNATYQKSNGNLTYVKPKGAIIAEPYLTRIPDGNLSLLKRFLSAPKRESVQKPLDTLAGVSALAIMAGITAASSLYDYTQRRKINKLYK